jgi:hypothetical protein
VYSSLLIESVSSCSSSRLWWYGETYCLIYDSTHVYDLTCTVVCW